MAAPVPPEPRVETASETPVETPTEPITREAILEAYARCGGVQARVPKSLGLRDRFQLARLEKKFGIAPGDRPGAEAPRET
jgi:transcriptional regulator with GAF, ATPase, and Fis domain